MQGWDMRNVILSPFSLHLLLLAGDPSLRASLNPLHQLCDMAHYLVTEHLAGNNSDIFAQACWCGSSLGTCHTPQLWRQLPSWFWYEHSRLVGMVKENFWPISYLGCLFFYHWVLRVVCTFWLQVLYLMGGLQIFSPVCGFFSFTQSPSLFNDSFVWGM